MAFLNRIRDAMGSNPSKSRKAKSKDKGLVDEGSTSPGTADSSVNGQDGKAVAAAATMAPTPTISSSPTTPRSSLAGSGGGDLNQPQPPQQSSTWSGSNGTTDQASSSSSGFRTTQQQQQQPQQLQTGSLGTSSGGLSGRRRPVENITVPSDADFRQMQSDPLTPTTILSNPLSATTPTSAVSGSGPSQSTKSGPPGSMPSSAVSASFGSASGVTAAGALSSSMTTQVSGGPDGTQIFDVDDMISRLLDVGYSTKLTKSVCLKNPEITAICLAAREVFLSQPTLIELSPPVKIVGDIHGQYTDLIRLFEMCGFPPSSNYLFLGDYVDRGKQSLETILLFLCYKIKYPENFFLLRGNHECATVTRVYGFYDECKRRCNLKIWKTFTDVFNCLPIAAVVASKIFCVHGGLSPSLSTMDDIRRIQRPTDVPDFGLLNDLLWSDPSDTAADWEDNERGVSYCFGKSVIGEFLARYDFDLICRAHMVVEDGYEFWNERTLVTIFSAPNYCGEFDNFGAVMSVSEDLLCAFELLKPLDGAALKKEMAKKRRLSGALPSNGT